jgi:hypothetical protein
MMRPALLLLALWAAPLRAADAPPAPSVKLPADVKVAPGAGYVKIQAQASGPVAWDVFASFEDASLKPQYDALPGNVLILGVPNSPGSVRVSAWVSGPAGGPPLGATCFVDVGRPDAPPAPAPNPAPNPPPGASPGPAAGKLFVLALGAIESPTLRADLAALGAGYTPVPAGDARLSVPAVAEAVKQAGGALPVLVVQREDGTFPAPPQRLPADAEVVALVKRLRGK